jgi:hypothetical protein
MLLEAHFLLCVFPRIIIPKKLINPPTKNLVEASGTIAKITNPVIISIIPLKEVTNSLFHYNISSKEKYIYRYFWYYKHFWMLRFFWAKNLYSRTSLRFVGKENE